MPRGQLFKKVDFQSSLPLDYTLGYDTGLD